MNLRKHWKNFILTAAAFFWASCSEDGSSEQVFVGPISDCNDDGSLNNGDVSSNCGGGMIALYGVAPVFDESSSSVTSSDSCEQGCDEMISSSSEATASSSSEEALSSSSGLVDKAAALVRGEVLCEEHGGVKKAIQYEPEWGSAGLWADQEAREEVRDSVGKVLKTDAVAGFSKEKVSCLELFSNTQIMVALYGAPMPEDENPYDIWQYACKDGEIVKDEAYQEKDREYKEAYDAAKQESLEKYRKEVSDCDNAKSGDIVKF